MVFVFFLLLLFDLCTHYHSFSLHGAYDPEQDVHNILRLSDEDHNLCQRWLALMNLPGISTWVLPKSVVKSLHFRKLTWQQYREGDVDSGSISTISM